MYIFAQALHKHGQVYLLLLARLHNFFMNAYLIPQSFMGKMKPLAWAIGQTLHRRLVVLN